MDSSSEKLQEDLSNSFALGNKEAHPLSINACIDLINSYEDNTMSKQAKKVMKQEEQCSASSGMAFANNGSNSNESNDATCYACGDKDHESKDCTKNMELNE